ncbi:hypothetical protein V5P93_004625 [Actinokineospora auranticolor]|uniref:HAF family extracellular repeat protein n=1 Tax=Actinokineospora auranticolor TaxID=155976 RepID=A0A2S6GB02_9PSEU|nr:hypothetical protein [Actinokineospora auranticolor]PPK60544.1 hypothetical protein CLV40_1515 [Actinokineospora auranticolor]
MATKSVLACVALLVIAGATPAAAAPLGGGHPPSYRVTLLPPLPDDDSVYFNAVNDEGIAVGSSRTSFTLPDHPVRWDRDGRVHALPTLGGEQSLPLGIDNRGAVVGWSQTPDGTSHPVRWDRGVLRELPVLPGDGTGSAWAITDAGVVYGQSGETLVRWTGDDAPVAVPVPAGCAVRQFNVTSRGLPYGTCAFPDGTTRVVRWSRDGTPRVLTTLGGVDVYADANERGVIVGSSGTPGVPVRWNLDGTLTRLAPVGDSPTGTASAISENGYVAGTVGSADPRFQSPVRWDPDGTAHRLDVPADRLEGFTAAVDEHGVVFGTKHGVWTTSEAVVWDRDGHLAELPNPDPEWLTSSTVEGMTRSGLVLGQFSHSFDGPAAIWRPIR